MSRPVPNQPFYSSLNLSTAGKLYLKDNPLHMGAFFRKTETLLEAPVVSEHATSTSGGGQKTFQGSSLGPALLCPVPDVLAHPALSPASRWICSESFA